MDPISDVLSLVKTAHHMSGSLDAGAPWHIHFPPYEGLRLYAVSAGECLIGMNALSKPIRLQEGDCLIFPGGEAFRAGSDLSLPATDALALFTGEGRRTIVNGGGSFVGIAGLFTLDRERADILLHALPPVLHVRATADGEMLHQTLAFLQREVREPQPGGNLMVQQLATMVLVQTLRLYLSAAKTHDTGWMFALTDPQLGKALSAIHGEPSHPWTLQLLAARAGMS